MTNVKYIHTYIHTGLPTAETKLRILFSHVEKMLIKQYLRFHLFSKWVQHSQDVRAEVHTLLSLKVDTHL
jgi:hypothetical protein